MKLFIVLVVVLSYQMKCGLKNIKINRYNDLNNEIQSQFQGLNIQNVLEINPSDESRDMEKEQIKREKDQQSHREQEQKQEQPEVDEFSQIINDITNNQFIPPVSYDDKFQENSRRIDKKEMIDQNVQTQMDQIQKEAEEESKKESERQKQQREYKINRMNMQTGLNREYNKQNKGMIKQSIQNKPNMRFFEIDDSDIKTEVDDNRQLQQNYEIKQNHKKTVNNDSVNDQQMLMKEFQVEEFKQLQDRESKVDNGIYNPARDDMFI